MSKIELERMKLVISLLEARAAMINFDMETFASGKGKSPETKDE